MADFVYNTRRFLPGRQFQIMDITSKTAKIAVLSALCALMAAFSGCALFEYLDRSIFGEERVPTDSDALLALNEEPTARPGVVLNVGVTANGSIVLQPADFQVNQDGDILLPFIGSVKCDKLTLPEIREKITKLYSEGFYKNPLVTVNFHYTAGSSASPWGTIIVQGCVGSPGPIDIPQTRDLTLTRALKLAGNVRSDGDKDDIQVSIVGKDGKITRKSYSLTKIGKGRIDLDVKLPRGATIYVPFANY